VNIILRSASVTLLVIIISVFLLVNKSLSHATLRYKSSEYNSEAFCSPSIISVFCCYVFLYIK